MECPAWIALQPAFNLWVLWIAQLLTHGIAFHFAEPSPEPQPAMVLPSGWRPTALRKRINSLCRCMQRPITAPPAR